MLRPEHLEMQSKIICFVIVLLINVNSVAQTFRISNELRSGNSSDSLALDNIVDLCGNDIYENPTYIISISDSLILQYKYIGQNIEDKREAWINNDDPYMINFQKSAWINNQFKYEIDKKNENLTSNNYLYKRKGSTIILKPVAGNKVKGEIRFVNKGSILEYREIYSKLSRLEKYKKIMWNDILILIPVYSEIKTVRRQDTRIGCLFKKKTYSLKLFYNDNKDSSNLSAVVKNNQRKPKSIVKYNVNLKISKDSILLESFFNDTFLKNLLIKNSDTIYYRRYLYFVKPDSRTKNRLLVTRITTSDDDFKSFVFPIILDVKLIKEVDQCADFDTNHSLFSRFDIVFRRLVNNKIVYY